MATIHSFQSKVKQEPDPARSLLSKKRSKRTPHPELWSCPVGQVWHLAEALTLVLNLHLKDDRKEIGFITDTLAWVILEMQDYRLYQEGQHGK